jgi:hypothetical protein
MATMPVNGPDGSALYIGMYEYNCIHLAASSAECLFIAMYKYECIHLDNATRAANQTFNKAVVNHALRFKPWTPGTESNIHQLSYATFVLLYLVNNNYNWGMGDYILRTFWL